MDQQWMTRITRKHAMQPQARRGTHATPTSVIWTTMPKKRSKSIVNCINTCAATTPSGPCRGQSGPNQRIIKMHLIVKPTAQANTRYEVDAEPSCTVLELKEKISGQASLQPSEQRLIYKGQILKGKSAWLADAAAEGGQSCERNDHHPPSPRADERTLESYSIQNDNVLHLVRGRPQAAAAGGCVSWKWQICTDQLQ
eukprot:119232-Pelagomonas_calceolata.AAC.3